MNLIWNGHQIIPDAPCWKCGKPATGWFQPTYHAAAAAPTNPGPFPECGECSFSRLGGVSVIAERDALKQQLAAANERAEAAREQIAQEACAVGAALVPFRRELALASEDGRGHVRKLIDVLAFVTAERDALKTHVTALRAALVEARAALEEIAGCGYGGWDSHYGRRIRDITRAALARLTAVGGEEG